MNTFKENASYQMTWVTNSNMITIFKVIKRTPKMIVIQEKKSNETIRCKVSSYDNSEYAMPYGKYSMAPSLNAKNAL